MERPHAALGNATPAERYAPSPRRWDGVLRSPAAKEYSSGARMYGLVESQLMWVMDMAAVGKPLTSHVSAQLKRVG